ncbi:protein kinase domain-containing protein [Aeriscardovia aeriphila]|uniref:non-specific serine/threonine protein kinase n=1 Tax=Aeriscardovia aeriphila TaxID=218139 RepID=A0A261FAI9_9BIFI|nr:protein kinase [Aeriscardovia aeriphila]NYI25708.1 serine/threonine-protein kinase [Aeriscardovia aeriphila]OZG56142.1 serine/threonine protein kinase [Aeriscardovia aeriphila]
MSEIIDGRYAIEKLLAQGGMASVYVAMDQRLERRVALKIIHSGLAHGEHGEQFRRRFHTEATAAARVANNHIVQVYDTGTTSTGLPYLVMEYVEGQDLRHVLETSAPLSVKDTLNILTAVFDGLAAAHSAGITHRDMKPENVLISSRGVVKIGDFGLAKMMSTQTTGTSGLMLATAAYVAPETLESDVVSPTADVYSVGMMAWEMLTGDIPFRSENPMTMVFKHVNQDVPSLTSIDPQFARLVVELVATLTSRSAASRPQNGQAAGKLVAQVKRELSSEQLAFRHDPSRLPASSSALSALAGAAPRHQASASTAPAPSASRFSQYPQRTAVQTPQPEARKPFETLPDLAHSENSAGSAANTQDLQSASYPVHSTTAAASSTGVSSTQPTRVQSRSPRQAQSGSDLRWQTVVSSKTSAQQATRPLPPSTHSSVPTQPTAPTQAMARGAAKPKHTGRKVAITALVVALLAGGGAGGYYAWYQLAGPGSYLRIPAISASCDNLLSTTLANGETSQHLEKAPTSPARPSNLQGATGQCAVEGSVWSAYSSRLTSAHVKAKVSEVYSDAIGKGKIISTSLQPGTFIKKDQASISLVVSQGPQPVIIPAVAGKLADEAQKELENAHLKVKVSEEFSDTVAQGAVIAVKPGEGQQVAKNSEITMVVSRGPEMATVPNVIGLSKDDAVSKLEALGFEVKTQKSLIGELLHQVFSQSIPGNTKARLRDTNGKPTVITLTLV